MKKIVIITFSISIAFIGALLPISNANSKNNVNNYLETLYKNDGKCIYGNFVADDGYITELYSLTLRRNCEFSFWDREDGTHTQGEYTLSRDIYRGGQSTITFYVNGENYGYATIVWPTDDENPSIIMNGLRFYKK